MLRQASVMLCYCDGFCGGAHVPRTPDIGRGGQIKNWMAMSGFAEREMKICPDYNPASVLFLPNFYPHPSNFYLTRRIFALTGRIFALTRRIFFR